MSNYGISRNQGKNGGTAWWGRERFPGVQKPSQAHFSCQAAGHHPAHRISWQQALVGALLVSPLGSLTPPALLWTHASTAILSSYGQKLNNTQWNYQMPFKSHSGCFEVGETSEVNGLPQGHGCQALLCAASQHPTINRPAATEATVPFRSATATPL